MDSNGSRASLILDRLPLGWLRAGMTESQTLDEHPDLEKDDFPAVYQFATEFGAKSLN